MLEPAARKTSPWRSLIRVLTDPGATFQSLGERPAILPGYIIQMAAGLLLFAVMIPLTNQLIVDQLSANPSVQVTPEQIAMSKNVALISSGVGSLLQPWLAGLLVALIGAFVGQFSGGSAGFAAYFGMAGYARMPLVLNSLVQTLLITQANSATEATSMSLSLAVFLPADSSAYLQALLGVISPFGIWYYVLLAFGFAALHRTRPAKGASFAGLLFALNLMFTLAGAALQSVAPGM